jgi:MFS family permease
MSAGLVGALSAVSFAAELFASIPMGLASDALQPRWLMTGGAVVGAFAVLFTISGSPTIVFVSRTLEGIGAAAIVPALLAYLADVTEGRPALRVRAMSYFELTLLAGLALGGIIAAQLFRGLHAGAFLVVALVYVACAVMLFSFGKRAPARKWDCICFGVISSTIPQWQSRHRGASGNGASRKLSRVCKRPNQQSRQSPVSRSPSSKLPCFACQAA